jgi:hypothetical protein
LYDPPGGSGPRWQAAQHNKPASKTMYPKRIRETMEPEL